MRSMNFENQEMENYIPVHRHIYESKCSESCDNHCDEEEAQGIHLIIKIQKNNTTNRQEEFQVLRILQRYE